MAPVPFDTHAVIHQLEDLGFSTAQAEGLSTVLAQVVAGQDYATSADIETLRVTTTADIAAVRADLQAVELRLDVKLEAAKGAIQADLAGVKSSLTWLQVLFGLNVTLSFFILGKLFLAH